MRAFIDEHRDAYGVEPICKVWSIAPSAYWAYAARRVNPALRSARTQRDAVVAGHLQRVFRDHFEVYRARKVWQQMRREGMAVARCTMERLMQQLGLQGVCGARPCAQPVARRPCSARPTGSSGSSRPTAPTRSGDTYGNALAETLNGLYKAEVSHRRAPWKSREAVELATLEWVYWFNHHHWLEPIGNMPPAEAERDSYQPLTESAIAV